MKKLMYLTVIVVIIWTNDLCSQGSMGEVMGIMFEKSDGNEPAYLAKVWVENGGAKIGAIVDEDGRFRISAVPVGTYQLFAQYGLDSLNQEIVFRVDANGIFNVGRIDILENIQIEDDVVIHGQISAPLINFGNVGEKRIDALDIMQSPVRNSPVDLIVSRNSDIKLSDDGQMIIRGARAGDMAYFIDGIKMQEAKAIPSVAIGGITVYSSAIPASYGDTTGGVIIMETKGYTDLYRTWKIMRSKNL
jgi:hypothetical protein